MRKHILHFIKQLLSNIHNTLKKDLEIQLALAKNITIGYSGFNRV